MNSYYNNVNLNRKKIVDEAKKLLGTPYKFGDNGPNSFDQTGFIQYVYKKAVGVKLPIDIKSLLNVGIQVNKEQLLPGDLIFTFNGNHVAIYIGNDMIIHPPYVKQKVKITPIYNFFTARKLL